MHEKKGYLFALLFLLLPLAAGAVSDPPDVISGVWAVEGSPYVLQQSAVVPSGEILQIEPGVVVYLEPGVRFLVHGELYIDGTEKNPVTFDGDPENPWQGIEIIGNGSAKGHMVHVNLLNVEYGVYVQGVSYSFDYVSIQASEIALELRDAFEVNFRHSRAETYCDLPRGRALAAWNSSMLAEESLFTLEVKLPDNTTSASAVYLFNTSGLFSENHLLTLCPSVSHTFFAVDCDQDLVITRMSVRSEVGAHTQGSPSSAIRASNSQISMQHLTTDFVTSGMGTPVNAVNASNYSRVYLYNSILGHSAGSMGASAVYVDPLTGDSNVLLDHCCLFALEDNPIEGVTYSHILQEDPLWLDPVHALYDLTDGSPCIDAGDPGSPPDPDGTVADLGRFPYYQTNDAPGAGEVALPDGLTLHPVYPNPFNGSARLKLQLPRAARVRLEVVDILGRSVEMLLDRSLQVGTYDVVWAPQVAAGTYFVQATTAQTRAVRRVTLLR